MREGGEEGGSCREECGGGVCSSAGVCGGAHNIATAAVPAQCATLPSPNPHRDRANVRCGAGTAPASAPPSSAPPPSCKGSRWWE